LGNKWHKKCGGKVVYQKPLKNGEFEQAGFCLKCNAFPLIQEEIIFEIDQDKVEKFHKRSQEWHIISRKSISENLE
jgi:hypothetical protein